MKINFEWIFDIDEVDFPNLSNKEIRDHFISCASSSMEQIEEEALDLFRNEENSK